MAKIRIFLINNSDGAELGPPVEITTLGGMAIEGGNEDKKLATLTSREHEIFSLLAEGLSLKEIASDTGLDIKTVDSHKTNLMRKLGVHNRVELTILAFRAGIIKLYL